MRHVQLTASSPAPGEPARIGMSGVEVEAVIVSVVAGLLAVKVTRTQAKAVSPTTDSKRKRRVCRD